MSSNETSESIEQNVQSSFLEWQSVVEELNEALKNLWQSINEATKSQGNCYTILISVEDWLNQIYDETCTKGAKVGFVLQEAQQALQC